MSEESQERALALERDLKTVLAGWLTPGSGAGSIKGDVKSRLFHAEAKYRAKQVWGLWVMPLDCQWLETIVRHAARDDRIPLLAVEWGSGERRAFLPSDDYWHLTQAPWQAGGDDSGVRDPLHVSLRIAPLGCASRTPAYYYFEKLEVPRRHWVALSWKQLALLRREHQPGTRGAGGEESRRFRRTGSGEPLLGARAPARFPKRPFPKRRKD